MNQRITLGLVAGIYALGLVTQANAAWPERSIALVVPFPAGGVTDSVARITADWLSKELKQSVVVENRPGASGAIATTYVARAPADGYTLLMASVVQMTIIPHMQKVTYNPSSSFAFASILGVSGAALALNPDFPAKTLPELIAYIKARPKQISFASAGNGSLSHLSMVLFLKRAGLVMNHVPYRGGALAVTDVLGGHIPMFFGNVSEVVASYNDNRLRIVGVSNEKRESRMPEVPTIAEQGFPNFSTYTWNGVAAPAGTPQPIVTRIAEAIALACKDAEVSTKLQAISIDPLCNTPDQFAAMVKDDFAKWGEAVKDAGLAVAD